MDVPPLLALPSLAALGGLVVGLFALARVRAIAVQDNRRRVYEVVFPKDVAFDSVVTVVRSLASMKAHPESFTQKLQQATGIELVPPLSAVFEVQSEPSGIKYRIGLPPAFADYAVAQMRGQMPGVRVTLEEKHDIYSWNHSVEISTKGSTVPLRIPDPVSVVHTILASLMPLKSGESLQMQWVVTPAEPQRPDKTDPDHKQKFGDHVYSVTGRLAARSASVDESRRLVRRLYAALGVMNSHGVNFSQQSRPHRSVHSRMHDRRTPIQHLTVVSATELATLIAFPVGQPSIPGLSQGKSRHLAPDPGIPEEGIILAHSNFPGQERTLAIAPENLCKHALVIGPTGVGKSTLLVNMALQQAELGYGGAIFDPKGGDLIDDYLARLPKNRLGDVIVLDPLDEKWTLALNPLDGPKPQLTAQQLFSVFDSLFELRSLPRTSDVARSALLTLALIPGSTILDLTLLLSATEAGKDFRYNALKQVNDRALRSFWHDFEARKVNEQIDIAAPLMRRLRPLELRPSLRAMLGQPKSTIDFYSIMQERKILLVPLSTGELGDETAALLGALLLTRLWQDTLRRGSLPKEQRSPFFVLLDEAQTFLHLPVSLADVLQEGRSYGLSLTLGHQSLSQLSPSLREAVLANARTKVVMQPASSDASTFAREFAPYVDSQDLQNLGQHEVVMRIATDGQMAPPVTAVTLPPPRATGSARARRAAAMAEHGRLIADVEAEIEARYEGFRRPQNKPDIGFEPAPDQQNSGADAPREDQS